MEIKDWVKAARNHAGLTLEQLGARLSRTKANVGHWQSGKHKPSYEQMLQISQVTGYPMPAIGASSEQQEHLSIVDNTEPQPDARGRVPLISWVQAGQLEDVNDHHLPGNGDEFIEVYDSRPGAHAFALRVAGDSMTSPVPGALSFPDGTIIIVDPSRGGSAGDFVVAKDVQTQQATFKKLTTDGGRWFLRPLNPAYPTLEIDDPSIRVIGKVTEYQIRGKL